MRIYDFCRKGPAISHKASGVTIKRNLPAKRAIERPAGGFFARKTAKFNAFAIEFNKALPDAFLAPFAAAAAGP
ncbi:MAG TPA: hypothetical protein VHM27_02620 [Rhizomicrobium sp.]|nr:hypothetical protein [Rhizomicrobium sp.]